MKVFLILVFTTFAPLLPQREVKAHESVYKVMAHLQPGNVVGGASKDVQITSEKRIIFLHYANMVNGGIYYEVKIHLKDDKVVVYESNSVATEVEGRSRMKSSSEVLKYRIADLDEKKARVELQLGNAITLSLVKP